MNCHVRRKQQRDDHPKDDSEHGKNDDLETEVVHDHFLVDADCFENPDLPAAVDGFDGNNDEQHHSCDYNTHNEGDKVDDGKTLKSPPEAL